MNEHKTITGLLAVVVLLAVAFFFVESRNRTIAGERDSWKDVAKVETEKANFWETESGKHEGQAKVAEANIDVIKEVYGKQFDSLRKDVKSLKKNLSNLQSVVGLSISTHGSLTQALHDTLVFNHNHYDTGRTFSYRDRWTDVRGYFLRDSVLLKYKFFDSLTIVNTWQKKHLFANRELQINALSYNPNSEITGLKSISVRQPKLSRFALGPFIGVDYRGRFSIGIGLSYRLISF